MGDLAQYETLIELAKLRPFKKGYHKHRIIPGYEGGEYIAGNVIYLTRVEHIKIHKLRWKLFKNYRDLLACKLLGERLTDKEWLTCAKAGGNITGQYFKENKLGLCGRTKEQMSIDGKKGHASTPQKALVKGGRITGLMLKKSGRGIFGIPCHQDKLNRAKGGRTTFSKLSYHDRTKGIVGTKWLTDGLQNIRLKTSEKIPKGFHFGRAKFPSLNKGF